jgi:AcrR family transcriptional regulator
LATSQKDRILQLALKLMAERGAKGMSMRDLANATGVNVATLYHYFPSKQDLLRSVMQEQGYLVGLEGVDDDDLVGSLEERLSRMLDDSWQSMLGIEDYIRLLIGEALRGDPDVQTVGEELLNEAESGIRSWVEKAAPGLAEPAGVDPAAVARLLRAVLIGVFFEHLTGTTPDPASDLRRRAGEVARILTG